VITLRRLVASGLMVLSMVVPAAAKQTARGSPLVNRPLSDVLREMQRAGLPLVFSSEVVHRSLRVIREPKSTAARQVLDEILAPHGLEARTAARGILLVVPRRVREATVPLALSAPATAIGGLVVDARTGAPLPGVVVRAAGGPEEAVTDADGRFDLQPRTAGAVRLEAWLVGYSLAELDVVVAKGTPIDLTIALADGARTHTEEVTVVGDRFRGAATPTPSTFALTGTDMRELRGVLADDAFRAVQVAPGVSTANDFRSEFSIRGSDFRHVGLLVDGLVVGWPVHSVHQDWSGGSVGLLNADTIDNLTLVSGVTPQDRPGRTGGWVDIAMREGSRTRTQAHGALGMTSASLITEGPLGRAGRGSWIVSARQSYLQWLIKRLDADGTTFGFSDVFAKLVFDVTPRHQVQALAIAGHSLLEIARDDTEPNLVTRGVTTTGLAGMSWRVTLGAATLTQQIGFTGATFTNDGPATKALADGNGREWSYRSNAAAAIGSSGRLQGGFSVRRRRLDQRFTRFVGFENGPRTIRPEVIAGAESEVSAYLRGSGRAGRVGVDGGVQFASPAAAGPALWASVVVPAGSWSVRAGAGLSRQRPSLEQSASTFGGNALGVETSRLFDLEIERAWGDGTRVAVTTYRRDQRHGLRLAGDEFRRTEMSVILPSLQPEWRNTLETRGSGIEVLAQRRSPTGWSGWVSYAYAVSRVTDVATGETWDADFDQRHTLNAHALLRWSSVSSISGKFRMASNVPIVGYLAEDAFGTTIGTERNRLRLPTYARFDVRVTRAFNFSSRRLTLFAEIVNLSGRRNLSAACACTNWADAPRVQSNGRVNGTTQKLFPFLPTIGFIIDF
jgi:hypothetical protein